MSPWLHQLGIGAAVAWVALPLLAWSAGRGRGDEPGSRQRALLVAFAGAALLVFVPVLRLAVPVNPVAAPPAATPASSTAFGAVAAASLAIPWHLVGAAWLGLAMIEAVRVLVASVRLRRTMSRGTQAAAQILHKADGLARAMGQRPPHVRVSEHTAVPFVTGVLRPTLVLPSALLSRVDEVALELLLRHELTHLGRGDHLWAAAVACLRVPLAFHPAAAWLCRELGQAREEAVDAQVSREQVHAYASLLVESAELARRSAAISAVAISSSSLERRIAVLTNPVARRPARLAPALAVFALVAWIPWAAPVAQAAEPASRVQVVKLKVGDKTTLLIPAMTRVAVVDPAIADVEVAGKASLRVIGQGKGTTQIVIWTEHDDQRVTYTVQVE